MTERVMNALTGRFAFLLRLFGTLLAAVLLVYLLSQQGWGEIIAAIQHIPIWRLLLAMGLMMISRFAVAGRWHVLLRSAGVWIAVSETLRVTFAGLFSTNFLPTTVGGDVVRLAGVIQLKFDMAICAASLIVDRLLGMAGMAMVVPFGLPSFLESSASSSTLIYEPSYLLASSLAAPLRKWGKPMWEKGTQMLHRIIAALAIWRKHPRSLLIAFVFSWINMLCLFSVVSLILNGMGENIPFWLIGGLFSIVYFVTLLPFSINGYGIQEVSMTFIFSTVGGASLQSGLTMALIFRTLMMIASLPGAAFVPELLAGAKNRPGTQE
ncbi:MAG: hypothetical protein A2Z45_00910 [Chloroflexi bacterium RBG_19FT_COMBO_55_16]|nr:MAG: hypothetical protein A2Z45_00910 [Chloroflexi bacterium RBG_19FT_COMBO_55_16]